MESSHPAVEKLLNSTSIDYQVVKDRIDSREREWYLLIGILALSDILMVALAFRVAYWIRFELNLPFFEPQAFVSKSYYEEIVLILAPLWVLIFALAGIYKRQILLGGTDEYARVFRGTTIGLLIVMATNFFEPEFVIARGWVVLAWGLTFLLVASGRFFIRRIAYMLRSRGYFLSRALIVGANSEAEVLADQLTSWTTSGLKVLGFVSDSVPLGTTIGKNLEVIGQLDDLEALIRTHRVREVIVAGGSVPQETQLSIFQRFGINDDVNLRMSLGLYQIITTGLSVKEFAYVPLVGVNKVRLTGLDRFIKSAMDFAFTIPILILLSPVLLLISVLVKIDSPGPVLHRREVMGLNCRTFFAFKFRTMHVNGDEILANNPELARRLEEDHKLKGDPRVTRLGRFLRRFSLDELPQFLNVLKRDMSLVGPRMISPPEMDEYAKWGINLLTVRPGITGLWQVSGRSDIGYEERVRLDMHYIRNWTIWLDIQLILQTIPAVLRGTGAY
jgi:exopolysaccharide biosynthesis polyprenyl glycosylphosphotransferase